MRSQNVLQVLRQADCIPEFMVKSTHSILFLAAALTSCATSCAVSGNSGRAEKSASNVAQKVGGIQCAVYGLPATKRPIYYRYSDLGKLGAPRLTSYSGSVLDQLAQMHDGTRLYFSVTHVQTSLFEIVDVYEGGESACTPGPYENLLIGCNSYYDPMEQKPDVVLPGDVCPTQSSAPQPGTMH